MPPPPILINQGHTHLNPQVLNDSIDIYPLGSGIKQYTNATTQNIKNLFMCYIKKSNFLCHLYKFDGVLSIGYIHLINQYRTQLNVKQRKLLIKIHL